MGVITPADVARQRKATTTLSWLAGRDLARAWKLMDPSRPEQTRDDLIEVVDALGVDYSRLSSVAAAQWYEQMRSKSGVTKPFTPRPEQPVNRDRIRGTVKWAAGSLWGSHPEETVATLTQSLDRWVRTGASATITGNAAADRACTRYARVPQGARTCTFCTMLASRGWVYASKASAGGLTRYHPGCDCAIVPSFGKRGSTPQLQGYDPDTYLALYEQGRARAGSGSETDILAAMRRANPDQYTDGVHAD